MRVCLATCGVRVSCEVEGLRSLRRDRVVGNTVGEGIRGRESAVSVGSEYHSIGRTTLLSLEGTTSHGLG